MSKLRNNQVYLNQMHEFRMRCFHQFCFEFAYIFLSFRSTTIPGLFSVGDKANNVLTWIKSKFFSKNNSNEKIVFLLNFFFGKDQMFAC